MYKKRLKNSLALELYQDRMARLYPEPEGEITREKNDKHLTRTVTFQVTDSCNLACTYCYQHNKGTRYMSLDVAKKFIELLLSGEKGFYDYINPEKSVGIILEFIGGEPFLAIDLIEEICNYWQMRLIELDHPWIDKYMYSICSNGTLYFDEKVQRFLRRQKDRLSFSVTIDGNKELHDSCRVFPDGRPSYDLAIAAAKDWMSRGYYMGSKITIAPGNINYMRSAIEHMIDLGYEEINANCVYEEGWTYEHAKYFYHALKDLAQSLIDRKLTDTIYISLFSDTFFKPKDVTDLDMWCGGTGSMLACDPDGRIYPCLRYMESSLGSNREPYYIGDVYNGIGQDELTSQRIECMNCITRKTQSTEECFKCPIAAGCSDCSAYNYECFGTPDSRATFICCMHKARALSNYYYYSRQGQPVDVWLPKEEALKIITEEEWETLVRYPGVTIKTQQDIDQFFHKL